MSEYISIQRNGNVALVYINNPPVNAGSLAVRRGILEAIELVEHDSALIGAVLIGAGKTFIAGSDLKEFGAPLEEPQLPSVIKAIERCSKPVIAAIHGSALGGGLELALGCDARVAAIDSMVGLPEVTLGMIPGAGGTQRLPRLVGIPKSIELICAGTRLKAEEAHRLGIIDAISIGNLADFAVDYLRTLGSKRQVLALSTPAAETQDIEAAAAAALKAGRHRPQVIAAIDAIKSAASTPADLALAEERRIFQDLRLSNDAFALRHLFFAERQSSKRLELDGVPGAEVNCVAVIGAGTMGCGITLALLQAGLEVILLEQNPTALQTGQERIAQEYQRRVAKGRLSQASAYDALARLNPTVDWAQLSAAQFVIEAVFEDLQVKQELLRKVEPLLRDGAIFATNTSYLDIDQIAEAAQKPQQVIGMHFFSPANVMRLVEVISGMYSAPAAVSTGFALARRLGKLPIVANNAFGFIGNRLYAAYRQQCEYMLEEGALPSQIDQAMESFGMAMGPFAVADLSGLDIAWRMRKARAHLRSEGERYCRIPDLLCEQGRLGRKTQGGYYSYDERGNRQEAEEVNSLILQESRSKGFTRQAFTQQQIIERALLTIANEAALLLAEGVTTRATDIDLVMVNGFGFPKWEGGPGFWAANQPLSKLNAQQSNLAKVSGSTFKMGDLAVFHYLHNQPSKRSA